MYEIKIVDAHTHIFPQYADLAVRVMDRLKINYSITLEWHNGFGSTLKKHLRIFRRHPERFIIFGNIDFNNINNDNFAHEAAEQMERDVSYGMRGLKIYKSLGLEYRHPNGCFWRVNDERLEPIWEKAGELDIPIIIHTADPTGFWQPVNNSNFWNGVLYGEYEWWSYYRKGYPSKDELLAERNDVIKRHPKTIFICPHIGSKADCLDSAADDLDTLPNLFYDLSARIPLLGITDRRADHSRRFIIEYADRILFGTDSIYDDMNIPTGIQAQCLFQPFEIPLGNADPYEKYVETSIEFIKSNIDFLTLDIIQINPPFKRNQTGYRIRGLNLPQKVTEKLFHRNIEKLLQID